MERISGLRTQAGIFLGDARSSAQSARGRAVSAFEAAYCCFLIAIEEKVVRQFEDHPSAELAKLGALRLGLCDEDVKLALLLANERYAPVQTLTLDETRAWSERVIAQMEAYVDRLASRDRNATQIPESACPETPKRPSYELARLLAEMQGKDLPRVEGWDEMPPAGIEKF
jgi:hypothetical protein